jgi:hypothetical protein
MVRAVQLVRWYVLIHGISSYLIYQSVTFQAARKALLTVQEGPIDPILLEGFSSPASNPMYYVDVWCCLARDRISGSVQLGKSSVVYERYILILVFLLGERRL